MSYVPPVVRHMLLCEDVRANTNNPRKLDLLGLANVVRVPVGAAFPLVISNMCAYLEITGARGTARVEIVAVFAETEEDVFGSPAHTVTFGKDPLEIRVLVFRLRDCIFPSPGLYWVEFRCDGRRIESQPCSCGWTIMNDYSAQEKPIFTMEIDGVVEFLDTAVDLSNESSKRAKDSHEARPKLKIVDEILFFDDPAVPRSGKPKETAPKTDSSPQS